ncbi:MAG: AI-2E family transporter [Patescibacteria group bacterium]|nr:AI-2E family transporter [Patescibacteria group bacterium]
MEVKRFDISWVSLWRVVIAGVLLIAAYYARDVFVVAFIALIISSALRRPVDYLESKHIPRILSVLMILLIAVAIIGLILYAIVPIILIQMKYVMSSISSIHIPFLENMGGSQVLTNLDQAISDWIGSFFYGGSNILNVLGSVVGNTVLVFVVIVLSLYLSISKGSIERFIRDMVPIDRESYVIGLYRRTQHKLGRWFTSQVILSVIIGAMTFAGLLLLGTDYALIIGILAALLEIVPYAGPIATGIVAFIMIAPQSASLAIAAIILFIVIHQIENHVLVPLIVGRVVGIDPVVVVLAILAGSQIDGLIGAILAIPVAIIIQEVMDDWSVKKRGITNSEA